MSTAKFLFRVTLVVGEETIPLFSEIVVGSSDASDGVGNGFIFRLDLKPGDGPVIINLGDMIGFIEDKLGAGDGNLARNPKVALLAQAFPQFIGSGGQPFTRDNTTQIEVKSFELNSTTKEFLFAFSVDVTSTDPTQGLIALPPAIANWVRIDNLAISFSATKKS